MVLLENVRNLIGPTSRARVGRHHPDPCERSVTASPRLPSVFSPHLLPPVARQALRRSATASSSSAPSSAAIERYSETNVPRQPSYAAPVDEWNVHDWDVNWILDEDAANPRSRPSID